MHCNEHNLTVSEVCQPMAPEIVRYHIWSHSQALMHGWRNGDWE